MQYILQNKCTFADCAQFTTQASDTDIKIL